MGKNSCDVECRNGNPLKYEEGSNIRGCDKGNLPSSVQFPHLASAHRQTITPIQKAGSNSASLIYFPPVAPNQVEFPGPREPATPVDLPLIPYCVFPSSRSLCTCPQWFFRPSSPGFSGPLMRLHRPLPGRLLFLDLQHEEG